MTQENKHTALPLKLVYGGRSKLGIDEYATYDAAGEQFLVNNEGGAVVPSFKEVCELVKACNNHYRLVEYLQDITAMKDYYDLDYYREKAQALLNEIEGK